MKFFRDIAIIWAALVERILYILDPQKFSEEIDYLRMQIQTERNEKMQIINQLTAKPVDRDEVDGNVTHQPVNPYIPWRVRRAQLEFEHRIKRSNEPTQTQKDIANLEEELEISND